MKPLPAAPETVAQDVSGTASRHEQPVNAVADREDSGGSRLSRDCDEEDQFYTPPSSASNSPVRLSRTISATGETEPPATVSTMPERVTLESVLLQRTQRTDKEAAHEHAEPSSPAVIESMVKRQDDMELEIQRHRRQLAELLKSHDDLAQGNYDKGAQGIQVSTMPERRATMESVPPQRTQGTDKEAAHEPAEPSSPVIVSMVERQNEMQLEIQQQRRQLAELLKSHDDLAQGNEKGAQGGQAEERAPAENNQILCLPLTDSHIHHISKDLVNDWKNVSLELKLTQSDVERIDADFAEVQEKTYQALLRWRRKETRNATVRSLVTVLENIGRRDVSDILKGLVSDDVSIPSAPPAVCQSDMAATWKEEYPAAEGKEPNDVGASEDFTDAQNFHEILENLHHVLQNLTQNEAHHKIIPEIKNLLKVQTSCEEKQREIIATRMPLQRKDSAVMEDLKAHQDMRMEQARQTRNLFSIMKNIPAEPRCKNCKMCKSCKDWRRRNTDDGLRKRPKISVKKRLTRSQIYE